MKFLKSSKTLVLAMLFSSTIMGYAQLPQASIYESSEDLETALQTQPTTEQNTQSFSTLLNEISSSIYFVHEYRTMLPVMMSMPLSTSNVDALKPLTPLYKKSEFSFTKTQEPSQEFSINKIAKGMEMDQFFVNSVQTQAADLIKVTNSDLLAHKVEERTISGSTPILNIEGINPSITKIADEKPKEIEVPKKYWFFSWNGALHLTQSYISSNWHKGGNSNFNLFNKHLLTANYKKERISWNNELEWRLSLFTSNADTVGKLRVADDLLRLHSNFGYESSLLKNLFYTLDAEVRTQLFKMREENKKTYLSGPLSPITTMLGLGAKYVYDWKSSTYGRKLHFEFNLSPLAYDFRWSLSKDIDLTRHGFKPNTNIYSAIGSMFRANLDFYITQSILWQSRLLFNTSYKRVETEWENGLVFSISKYLSTRLNLALRFDDAVQIRESFFKRLQINQLLSFGIEVNFTR